ncbi:hypothetical protein [Streptomyces sp. NPDC005209]|uniref:hypothetical protein n=1 Tax=Streptomyces sp. NPDC005209 TaxID=3156715 RepID=UPI0033A6A889
MNIRLLALAGVVACAIALPLTLASARSSGDAGRAGVRTVPLADAKEPTVAPSPSPSRSPLLLGLGLATAVRCGPELSSPDGVEAQTCVLAQGEETWARTYYRNSTGRALDAVLSLMEPGGRTLQMRCAVDADDEPATCETPREHTRGGLDAYTAVTEFAVHGTRGGRRGGHGGGQGEGDGPLLLRSGSNSDTPGAS